MPSRASSLRKPTAKQLRKRTVKDVKEMRKYRSFAIHGATAEKLNKLFDTSIAHRFALGITTSV